MIVQGPGEHSSAEEPQYFWCGGENPCLPAGIRSEYRPSCDKWV